MFYLSGTRAEFGLMRSTLSQIHDHAGLELGILVTGMHLDARFGSTVREIEDSNLPIVARLPVALGDDGASMARAIASALIGIVETLTVRRPDCLLLLGDRGEMLAGALAALHLNIPIAHIHGGELSGTVDEPIRHAISKLSHYHFTATAGSRERLIRMGEQPGQIFVTGAPGLDGLCRHPCRPRAELARSAGFDPAAPIALVVFHPVVQQAADAGAQAEAILQALGQTEGMQSLLLMPNSDAGGQAIRTAFQSPPSGCRTLVHLPRPEFIEWVATVDVMLGNSSSGIIEAATFGTPVIDIGERQQGRDCSSNVRHVPADSDAIAAALRECLSSGRCEVENTYGDGHSGARITSLLATLPFGPELLMKRNAY